MEDVEGLEMAPVSRYAQVDLATKQEELDTVYIEFVSRDRRAILIRGYTQQNRLLFMPDSPTFELSCPEIRDDHFCIYRF